MKKVFPKIIGALIIFIVIVSWFKTLIKQYHIKNISNSVKIDCYIAFFLIAFLFSTVLVNLIKRIKNVKLIENISLAWNYDPRITAKIYYKKEEERGKVTIYTYDDNSIADNSYDFSVIVGVTHYRKVINYLAHNDFEHSYIEHMNGFAKTL